MATVTEGKYPGEFLASRANGTQSVDSIILITLGSITPGSTVLGLITSSNKYTPLNVGASDGSQVAAAILYANTDSTGGDAKAVAVTRNCEVNSSRLTWPAGFTTNQIATATAQLAAKGILSRGPAV